MAKADSSGGADDRSASPLPPHPLTMRVQQSALTPALFYQLIDSDACKLETIHGRLARLQTMLGLMLYTDGFDEAAKDIFALALDQIAACVAIAEPVERVQ